jgi:hypothetical protein
MSGFETAAGAFAVVGVIDVLVRTGRDLYSFFHDVADAQRTSKDYAVASVTRFFLAEAARSCLATIINCTPAGTASTAVESLPRPQKLSTASCKVSGP